MLWMISPGNPKQEPVSTKQDVNSSTIEFDLKQVCGLSVPDPCHYAPDASSLDGDI